MAWTINYHPEVVRDLLRLGMVEAKTVMKVIEKRIDEVEPEKLGKPLSGQLASCRRIRTGQTRIVYRINDNRVEVLIIAVGMRRDNQIYDAASSSVE